MDLIAATTKKTPSLSTKTGILYFHQRGKTKPQKKTQKTQKEQLTGTLQFCLYKYTKISQKLNN